MSRKSVFCLAYPHKFLRFVFIIRFAIFSLVGICFSFFFLSIVIEKRVV